jgi:hypothetical protein
MLKSVSRHLSFLKMVRRSSATQVDTLTRSSMLFHEFSLGLWALVGNYLLRTNGVELGTHVLDRPKTEIRFGSLC